MATKPVKKKAPATRGAKVARRARPTARRGGDRDSNRLPVHPDERDFLKREAEIRAAARARRTGGRFSFEDTVHVALRLWTRANGHAEVIRMLDRGLPGAQAAFDALPEYARALRYLNRRHAMALGAESQARVPGEIMEASKALMSVMSDVIRYNLGPEEKIAKRLAFLRSGSGYRHTWIALETYASIYEDFAGKLAEDKRWYDPSHGPRARALSVQISDLLRKRKAGSAAEWAELRPAAHALLADAYERLARVLCAIESERPRSEFPPLGVAVNAVRKPRTKRSKARERVPSNDEAPRPPARRTPATEETPA